LSEATRRERADSEARTALHARRRRVIAGLGVFVLVVVLGLGFAWWRLEGNISRLDVSDDLGTRPTAAAGPLNILLIGSDNREGEGVPGASLSSGARSDTTLIAHVSADRQHVTVVSVPRDSMVPAPPDCKNSTPKDEWVVQQWNAMFGIGGPACLITTIEGNTGLRMDHFAVVDFNGFRDMVNALGGVPICAPEAIDDPKAKLKLSAGRHVLDGTQALGYVRARKTLGDGSDLGRIERQQAFLSSVVQEATRTSLLLRPDKLFGFLDAATSSLTTDEDFDLGTMKDLASSVADIGMSNVQFVTVPVQEYPADPNRVEWAPSAEVLWQTLRDDGVVGATPSAAPSASAGPLMVSPTEVAVEVVNATGVQGLAAQVAAALEVQGFAEVTTGSSGSRPNGVVVEYGAGGEEAARTVAAAFEGATLREDASVTSGVRVVLGAGAPAVQELPNRTGSSPVPTPTVSAPSPSPTPTITTRPADRDICS
jgi:LCP family protein required for cell wall assembly